MPELRSAQPDRVSSARLSALTVSLDREEPTLRATGRDESSTRSCHRVQVRSILDAAQPDVFLEFDSDKRNIRAGLRILRGESQFMERKKERKMTRLLPLALFISLPFPIIIFVLSHSSWTMLSRETYTNKVKRWNRFDSFIRCLHSEGGAREEAPGKLCGWGCKSETLRSALCVKTHIMKGLRS